jgi:hypothetical protein
VLLLLKGLGRKLMVGEKVGRVWIDRRRRVGLNGVGRGGVVAEGDRGIENERVRGEIVSKDMGVDGSSSRTGRSTALHGGLMKMLRDSICFGVGWRELRDNERRDRRGSDIGLLRSIGRWRAGTRGRGVVWLIGLLV